MFNHRSQRTIHIVAAILLAALVVTGCGGSQPTAAVPTSAPSVDGITVPAQGESPTIDKIRRNGKLRLGVAVAAPWLLQNPSNNSYYGPTIDIAERVSKTLGVPIEYVDSGWDVLVAGIQSDKFDIAIAPMFASPARDEVIDFVNYTKAGTCYFTLKENAKVSKLDDLNKAEVTIVAWTGTGTEEGIRKKYPNATVRSVVQPPGGQAPIEEVLSGRADVGPFDSPLAVFIAEKYPQLKIIPESPEYCINNADIPYPIGMGFLENDDKLAGFLQAIVDDMQADINANIVKYSAAEYIAP